jgi:hypothetical protein
VTALDVARDVFAAICVGYAVHAVVLAVRIHRLVRRQERLLRRKRDDCARREAGRS